MRKFSILILSLVAASLMVLSCEKTTETPEQTSEQAGETTDNNKAILDEAYYTGDLSNETFDGYNYRILVRKGSLGTQYLGGYARTYTPKLVYRSNIIMTDNKHT